MIEGYGREVSTFIKVKVKKFMNNGEVSKKTSMKKTSIGKKPQLEKNLN